MCDWCVQKKIIKEINCFLIINIDLYVNTGRQRKRHNSYINLKINQVFANEVLQVQKAMSLIKVLET